MDKALKRVISGFMAVWIVLLQFSLPVAAEETEDTFLTVANEIISWKKADNGSSEDGWLLNDNYLELAGSTAGDWYPIGLGRLGIADNYDGYLAVIKDRVEERYAQSEKLSAAKATEWHRIVLAILAMGGNPTAFGKDVDGNPIDLIEDGTYNRGKTTSLGRQGINGWIWGLIALDSMRYSVPEGAHDTREDIIVEILRQQLMDGGFALGGTVADPDMTAMAVQALAPYYNSEQTYTYTRKVASEEVTKSVREVIDEAVACLSVLQLETGDYRSWSTENVESTCQVTVALCCLGIDPLTDERFIKNGNTLFDGILRYRMDDGGFIHAFSYDPDNPTALPNESNTMAGEQVLYTMAALWRQKNGMRTLYDFRSEQSEALKERISSLEQDILSVGEETEAESLKTLLIRYYSIPDTERSYVYHYRILSDAAAAAGIDIGKIAADTEIIQDTLEADTNRTEEQTVFTEEDKKAVDALPQRLTTEQYVAVTTLLEKIEHSADFADKEYYLQNLTEAKKTITEIQNEIDLLNADIIEKLYPFDTISLKDKEAVEEIYNRCMALSEYDRGKIERFEDVIKTKTKVDNLLRAVCISVILIFIAGILITCVTVRVRRRHRRKLLEMEELAAQYADDEE